MPDRILVLLPEDHQQAYREVLRPGETLQEFIRAACAEKARRRGSKAALSEVRKRGRIAKARSE